MKLLIATPFYNNSAFAQYVTSIVATSIMLKDAKIDFEFQVICGCAYIDDARNDLAMMLLKSDATHILYIDSDMQWDAEGLSNILQSNVDVCGATYRLKGDIEEYPVNINTNNDDFYISNDFAGPAITNEKGLISAVMCPTGFMLIKRIVFEKLITSNPEEYYLHPHHGHKVYDFFGRSRKGHKALGEDVSFCRRWLACGGEIWVEPRCTITHYGSKGWKGNYHNYLMSLPKAIKKEPIIIESPINKNQEVIMRLNALIGKIENEVFV